MTRRPRNEHGVTRPRGGRDGRAPDGGPILLWGAHGVEAALRNPRRKCRRLLATEAGLARVSSAASERGVRIEPTSDQEIARRLNADAVHQGLLLECDPLPRGSLDEIVLDAEPGGRLVLILDQITDPPLV